ncbi:MAG: hypothetical protein JRF59_01220 [Deltaproteobacteria bacterium]|nr:hypothetical protein [Deltaproteobacteria bacterium]MBW1922329.1 hypothetical protein [Deltaproteobacteria bacterium]MBW1948081.1 hypothetical protein [Deltaproteobacteria bacterium]MBW2006506.1 hypothetical protein [Deltaproteobacteria bacterium]MBW2101875.1 hypothetical protein [Deltaproteobacteria bacterium]
MKNLVAFSDDHRAASPVNTLLLVIGQALGRDLPGRVRIAQQAVPGKSLSGKRMGIRPKAKDEEKKREQP